MAALSAAKPCLGEGPPGFPPIRWPLAIPYGPCSALLCVQRSNNQNNVIEITVHTVAATTVEPVACIVRAVWVGTSQRVMRVRWTMRLQ